MRRFSVAKKTNFLGPKKRGRPATGRDQVVKVGLPASLLQRIDRWAGGFEDMDRSTALRCLLFLGLGRSRSKAATVYDPKGFKAHHNKRRGGGARVSEKPTVLQPFASAERRGRLVLIKNGASP